MFGTLKLDRRAPKGRRGAMPVGLLALSLAFGRCASPTPSVDPARTLHFQSRLSQAVVVEIGSRGGGVAAYTTALRPCGGSLVLVPGLSGVPTSNLLITLLVDPAGLFDARLARFSGNPHDMDGSFDGLSILWSTTEIQTAGLPRWVTVTPEAVVVEEAPPAPGTTCGPWLQQG